MCESTTPLFLGKIEWVLLPLGKYYPPVFGQNKGFTLHFTSNGLYSFVRPVKTQEKNLTCLSMHCM